MEENEVGHPFDCRMDVMVFQDSDGGISHTALNSTSCGKPFNCDVLNIDTIFPEDAQVLFVTWTDGRLTIRLGDVQGGGFCSRGA